MAIAIGCLWGSSAWALGLGRLTVQSALGETLRAEIEVTNMTADEAGSLDLRVASPEAYRAAGVEYNAALAGAAVTLQRRADGRPYLRVTSERALVEPFVDVIVEATWASGRIVREYTVLLDPPTRFAAAPQPTTPPAAAPAPAPAPAPVPLAAAPAPAPAAPAAAPLRPAPSAAPAPRVATAAGPDAGADEVRVRAGDTLMRVAGRTQRSGVSLDQMLVSLFRANPQAFVGDNMNRLKAGAVLTVPSADAVRRITPSEARDVIVAQSSDFAAYRQRLASGVPAAPATEAPARQAGGTVQARVDERRPGAAPSPDKLTLSQGGVKPTAPEARIAREGQKKDDAQRVAELSRNVDDLKRLQQGTQAPAQTTPATRPASPAPAPAVTPAPTPAPAPAPAAVAPTPTPPTTAPATKPATTPLPAPTLQASVPSPAPAASAVAAAPNPPVTAPPPGPEEPGFVAMLSENPLVLYGAGALLALLAGLGLYRARAAKKKATGETSFLESRLQPDSFFGASGGQRIDTREAAGQSSSSSSSMSYSLSQLDAIGDVDPVAEADVYLAYGRDLQAEEILKEAMRANPSRMAIRTKLLEVYAKRRDAKGFELLATQVYSLTQGEGEDWAKVQEMGLQIDPDNPLYQPGGQPEVVTNAGGQPVEPLSASTLPHAATKPPTPAFAPDSDLGAPSRSGGVDLDLDLDVAPSPAEQTRPLTTSADITIEPTPAFSSRVQPRYDEQPTQPAAMLATPASASADTIDFDLGDLSLDDGSGKTVPLPRSDSPPKVDFGDFMLESPADQKTVREAPPAPGDGGGDEESDPLARKLELAEEFRQIGDLEGARDLLEEVIAKAEGTLKSKAQVMLEGLA